MRICKYIKIRVSLKGREISGFFPPTVCYSPIYWILSKGLKNKLRKMNYGPIIWRTATKQYKSLADPILPTKLNYLQLPLGVMTIIDHLCKEPSTMLGILWLK